MAPELYTFLEVGYCITLKMKEETEIYGEQGRSQKCRMPGQFRAAYKADTDTNTTSMIAHNESGITYVWDCTALILVHC